MFIPGSCGVLEVVAPSTTQRCELDVCEALWPLQSTRQNCRHCSWPPFVGRTEQANSNSVLLRGLVTTIVAMAGDCKMVV